MQQFMLQAEHVPKSGWFTVYFLNAEAVELSDRSHCDCLSDCDPYVALFIDDEMVYRTSTKRDSEHPNFHEVYESYKIGKQSRITFEMWDDDLNDDDLMFRRHMDLGMALGNESEKSMKVVGSGTNNNIHIKLMWKEEPVDLKQYL